MSGSSFLPSAKTWLEASLCIAISIGSCLAGQGQDSAQATSAPLRPLITQVIDETQLTRLRGNTHPLARPEFDLGTAPASLPMERMLLVLKRSPDQEYALRKLLDDQQDKKSPNYHKWMTPEEYGRQFGPTDADLQTITGWLQSHGFSVGTTKGRTLLEFSGSASQVQEAFHSTIHKYLVNGEQHWANANDPSIPTALVPAVRGVLTLHNFLSKPQSHFSKEPVLAKYTPGGKRQVTFPAQNGQAAINALEPQDYAVIYNIGPAYSIASSFSPTIGVVARSDLYNGGEDIQDFHNEVGTGNGTFGGLGVNLIFNGPDPGISGGDEAEAILDGTWSSSIASYTTTTDLVVSGSTNTTDGIDLSEQYIIENNLADIMTESFSTCEYYSTDARIAGVNALAEQAAAQGITYFVSTGDSGAEGCDDPSTPPAQGPVSVNLFASTPFTVAVGGTMFNENGDTSKYWTSSPPISETALSYIPEDVWNESSLTNGLWSGSGGASAGNYGDTLISPAGTTKGFAKPSWQRGAGLNIPVDGVRDLPDVALTAAGHDPYLICYEGSCVPNGQGYIYVYFISGTSASAPSFAGIMALVDQSQGGRQGQADYVLYALAASQAADNIYPSQCNGSSASTASDPSCIFHDVTVGNNVVPGEVGSLYQAGAGYDLASGLGSVNVANLVNGWSSATFNPTTTTLTLGSTSNITHGEPVSATVSVSPSSGTGKPTGEVSLLAENDSVDCFGPTAAADSRTLSSGSVSFSTTVLPGGGPYCVWAHYGGDTTYASSNSNSTMVTVNPEASTTTLSLQVTDLYGNPLSSPYPFGSLVNVRADVSSANHNAVCQSPTYAGCPSGSIQFTDTFGPLPTSNPQTNPPVAVVNPVPLNSEGNASIGDAIISFDAGNHTISGAYGGDSSFNASNSTAPISFTIQPGFIAVSGPTDVTVTAPGVSGVATVGIITSTGFTTAISFSCTSGLPAEATCISTPVTGSGPNSVVNGNITVTTTAPHTAMLQSNGRRNYYALIFGGGLPVAGIFLLMAPRRRRWSSCLGLFVMALLVAVPACSSGGGGGSHQDPGTPAGSYSVTVTATAGSITSQGTFTLTVQ